MKEFFPTNFVVLGGLLCGCGGSSVEKNGGFAIFPVDFGCLESGLWGGVIFDKKYRGRMGGLIPPRSLDPWKILEVQGSPFLAIKEK